MSAVKRRWRQDKDIETSMHHIAIEHHLVLAFEAVAVESFFVGLAQHGLYLPLYGLITR